MSDIRSESGEHGLRVADAARAEALAQHDIVVSIINYRTGEMTLDCVRSVLADIGDLDVHVVVVDNRSDDGSAELIEEWIAAQTPPVPVTLVRSETNSGYSGGHNQGMSARPAEASLILNSDALLRPGALAALLGALRARPKLGLVGPRIEYEDGTVQDSCFRFPTPLGELTRAARTGLVTRLLRRSDLSLGSAPDPAAIEWVSFACVLVRGSMRAEIGPMDEGYFLYSEDIDYCWRARRAGWAIAQAPEARAVHFRGGSGPVKTLIAARKRLPAYFYASRARFFRLAHGHAGLLAGNLLWYVGRGIRIVKGALKGEPRSGPEKEWLDIWTNFLDPLGDDRRPLS